MLIALAGIEAYGDWWSAVVLLVASRSASSASRKLWLAWLIDGLKLRLMLGGLTTTGTCDTHALSLSVAAACDSEFRR